MCGFYLRFARCMTHTLSSLYQLNVYSITSIIRSTTLNRAVCVIRPKSDNTELPGTIFPGSPETRKNGPREKWSPGKMVPEKHGSRKNGPQEKWSPEKWSSEKWSPRNMIPEKMVPGKNGPRKNGPQKNGPRKNGPQEKWSPEYWCPEKWSPGNSATNNRRVGVEHRGVCVECWDVINLWKPKTRNKHKPRKQTQNSETKNRGVSVEHRSVCVCGMFGCDQSMWSINM